MTGSDHAWLNARVGGWSVLCIRVQLLLYPRLLPSWVSSSSSSSAGAAAADVIPIIQGGQYRTFLLTVRGVARRVRGTCPQSSLRLQSSIEWIFTGKNWLCWHVGPALFSKATLFSLPEVFYGPQTCQKYGPRCWEISSFEGD